MYVFLTYNTEHRQLNKQSYFKVFSGSSSGPQTADVKELLTVCTFIETLLENSLNFEDWLLWEHFSWLNNYDQQQMW